MKEEEEEKKSISSQGLGFDSSEASSVMFLNVLSLVNLNDS